MRYVLSQIKLILFFLLFVLALTFSGNIQASDVQVSATVGEAQFTLYGYSSPQAKISMTGVGIYDQTVADDEGFFEFKNRFSPLSPREACITAQDQFGRLSPPTCLPPFPSKHNVTIGPVLLPATLSFSDAYYFIGDEVVLSGQTIPNSNVELSLFNDQNQSISLIGKVYAESSRYQLKSDSKGNFSVALPSSEASSYRLFTLAKFQKETSPKSLTLYFKVLPTWMIIIKFFMFMWQIALGRALEIIILAGLISLALYIFHHHFHPHKVRMLALRNHYEIEKFSQIKINDRP